MLFSSISFDFIAREEGEKEFWNFICSGHQFYCYLVTILNSHSSLIDISELGKRFRCFLDTSGTKTCSNFRAVLIIGAEENVP